MGDCPYKLIDSRGYVSWDSLNEGNDDTINKVQTALSKLCAMQNDPSNSWIIDSSLKDLLTKFADVLDICKEDDSGMSPLEYALKMNNFVHVTLIRDEAYRRLIDPENKFRLNLREKLDQTANASEYDFSLFRQALETDPEAAYKYLDQFVENQHYKYEFKKLDKLYEKNDKHISPLAAILKDGILPSQNDAKLKCLEHPAMRRLLDIKWELFAARIYYQHLLIYFIMLMCMTNVLLSSQLDQTIQGLKGKNFTDAQWLENVKEVYLPMKIWVIAIIFCFFAFIHVNKLEPHCLHKMAYYSHFQRVETSTEPTSIPQAAECKARVRSWLVYMTIFWTLVFGIPALCVLQNQFPHMSFEFVSSFTAANMYITSAVLWLCALFFLILEIQELRGEKSWVFQSFRDASWCSKLSYIIFFPLVLPYIKYFQSFTNKLQLVTYLIILGPFTYYHYYYQIVRTADTANDDIYFCFGTFCTISLWMLSLQFLEVNRSCGYLLPIVKDVLGDVWDFLIFYGVFQLCLTCGFYFVFEQKTDGYKTLWESFTSTYFVMYGDNAADAFTSVNDDGTPVLNDIKSTIGLILRMFHCAVMVILLLNLLLAIMNKTVDRNWEKLQLRALTSYARAIHRIESTARLFKWDYSKTMSFENDQLNTNPVFTEKITRVELLQANTGNDEQTNELMDEVVELRKEIKFLQEKLLFVCDHIQEAATTK